MYIVLKCSCSSINIKHKDLLSVVEKNRLHIHILSVPIFISHIFMFLNLVYIVINFIHFCVCLFTTPQVIIFKFYRVKIKFVILLFLVLFLLLLLVAAPENIVRTVPVYVHTILSGAQCTGLWK